MSEKVAIVCVEVSGDKGPRVILSDGKELQGLTRIEPCEFDHGGPMKVRIEAIIYTANDGSV